MKLFSSVQSLEQALNVSTLRQRVISSNIANVDTPHYKSKEVVFSKVLDKAMHEQGLSSHKTNAKHIEFSARNENISPFARVLTKTNTSFNHNGNNVDMDYEMAQLAKNQLLYNALIDRTNGRFSSLKTVINEGR